MHFNQLSTPQRISGAAILVVVLAVLLPWVSLFGASAIDVEGDGVISLALALAGAVVLAVTTGLFG